MTNADMEMRQFGSLLGVPLRNGLNRPTKVRGRGVKMVNMGELFAYSRIGNVDMERVPLTEKEADSFLLEPGDLLFARQSLKWSGAGKCSIFDGADEPITFEGHIIRARLDKQIASPQFYYYFFNSLEGRQTIETIIEQVAAAGIRGSDLARLEVPYPPLSLQHAIARILGALDDKIELNRHMNRTLEAMAAALFKSWFVDFDPVTAKAEGRQPHGMSAETATLFPAAFQESELGPIPQGWQVVPIGEMVSALGGSTPSTANPAFWVGGTYAWATPKDLARLSDPVLLATERCVTAAGLEQCRSGMLPQGTVLMSSRAPVGYLAITEIPVAINQGFIAMVCDKGVPNHYILRWLAENMDVVIAHANGTTFLEISKANFRPIPALLPAQPILNHFDALVGSWHAQMVNNLREMHTLSRIRALLLPKLLSGGIRVNTAERTVKATLTT